MSSYLDIFKQAGWKKSLTMAVAFVFGTFHLYATLTGRVNATQLREIHLLFAMILLLLTKPASAKHPDSLAGKIWTVAVAVFSIGSLGYLIVNYSTLIVKMPYSSSLTPLQYALVVLLILSLLECTRRAMGLAVPIVSIAALLYILFGQYIGGTFGHKGFTFKEMAYLFGYTTDGVFGTALGTSATFVILFVIFGAFLEQAGVSKYFMDLAMFLTAKSTGGPAKMAVISSCLFGSISGSCIANVATTGQITIPLMKRAGYKSEFAGAVEAVASTGGQLMPPVMGAAAFVLCDFTGIPYAEVIKSAALPALLFYAAVFFMVHFEALKKNIKSVDVGELPSKKELLRDSYMLLPLVMIIVLVAWGFTATYACIYAIAACVIISWFKKENRMMPKKIALAIANGAKGSVGVALTCATAGIVVGVVNYSGLGLKFTSLMLSLGKSNLFLVLLLTAIATMILGMGLPTTPAFIVVASLMVPAITALEVPTIAAYMFAFYFANVANITPPVALAAYTAAGLADCSPMKTGLVAFRLGIVAYIVPFMFVYNTSLLLVGDNLWSLIAVAITSFIGVYLLSVASSGWMLSHVSLLERILFAVAALTLIWPGTITDIIGLCLGGQGSSFRK